MKNISLKLKLLTLLFFILLFANCRSQSNLSSPKPTNPFIGRWEPKPPPSADPSAQTGSLYSWIEIKADGICRMLETGPQKSEKDCNWKSSGKNLTITTWDNREREYTLEDDIGGKKVLVSVYKWALKPDIYERPQK